MSCETNGCQRPSTAGFRPSLSGAVETAPAGNTTTTPPRSSCARAAARDARLVRCASSVSLKSIGRMKPLHLRRPHQHGVGQHDEVRPDLADEPGNDDAVEHAVRVVGHHHDRAGLRDRRQRIGVVADVERERAHRRLPETLVRPRKPLVVDIHLLQLRLAGRLFDETDDAALQRRIARGRVAEEIFVHDAELITARVRNISRTRLAYDKRFQRGMAAFSAAAAASAGGAPAVFGLRARLHRFASRSKSCNSATSASKSLSGTMFGPSEGAWSGSGWVSMNTPATPTATAARASTGDELALAARRGPLPARLLHRMGGVEDDRRAGLARQDRQRAHVRNERVVAEARRRARSPERRPPRPRRAWRPRSSCPRARGTAPS